MYVRQILTDARAREKPCLRCGLSLRKHLDDRYCPDCGLSVWMSLNPNESLDYSNTQWLRKAARGSWLMAAIQVIALAAYLIGFAGMVMPTIHAMQSRPVGLHRPATRPSLRTAGNEAASPTATTGAAAADDELLPWDVDDDSELDAPASAPQTLATALAGLYFIAEAGGLVLMTVHEQRYPDRAKGMRVAARVMAGIAVVVGLGMVGLAARWVTTGHGSSPLLAWLFLLVVEITFGGCAFVSWYWLRPIARRAGKSSLAKLCGYLLFLPVLPFLKAAPFLGLWMFYLVSPLLYFLPLIYIPLSIYLFARCGRLLTQAIPHAEATWAAESKPVAAS
ncbi:MAG: hypothetical protein JWM57_3538 [Phycisphaerales bacterium]|nr:hypothetical protein [Phycisphaerales bacterium]